MSNFELTEITEITTDAFFQYQETLEEETRWIIFDERGDVLGYCTEKQEHLPTAASQKRNIKRKEYSAISEKEEDLVVRKEPFAYIENPMLEACKPTVKAMSNQLDKFNLIGPMISPEALSQINESTRWVSELAVKIAGESEFLSIGKSINWEIAGTNIWANFGEIAGAGIRASLGDPVPIVAFIKPENPMLDEHTLQGLSPRRKPIEDVAGILLDKSSEISLEDTFDDEELPKVEEGIRLLEALQGISILRDKFDI